MGFELNEEQKVRISLSNHAYSIMKQDMAVFSVDKQATFINTIITNYHEDSMASLSLYLLKKRYEYLELFDGTPIEIRNASARQLTLVEEKRVTKILKEMMKVKDVSKLYHINNENTDYLLNECEEDDFYKDRAGLFIKCLLEDYARLPFIEREQIYRKEVFELVEKACQTGTLMQVRTKVNNINQTFIVYPYKILPDTLNSQLYLACYTRKPDASPKEKREASFSMARLEKPKLLKQTSFLSNSDREKLEKNIAQRSIVYLLSEVAEIHVKLTETGKRFFHNRIVSRPIKNDELSTDNEYVFFCTEEQAFLYFFPFGKEAEIISPASLRERVIKGYKSACENYDRLSKGKSQ